MDLWKCLRVYFLKVLLKKTTGPGSNGLKIIDRLNDPTMKARILFVASSASTFESFTRMFQTRSLIVHLYPKLRRLVRTILSRICKPESIENWSSNAIAKLIDDALKSELDKLSEIQRASFYKGVRADCKAGIIHLVEKTLVANPIVKLLNILHPAKRNSRDGISAATNLRRFYQWAFNLTL